MTYRPFTTKIKNINLHKFSSIGGNANGNTIVDILPLFTELNLYQSLFEPLLRGELYINDSVGLFHNFPLSGEEFYEIIYEETDFLATSSITKKLYFVADSIIDIAIDDRARIYSYKINLIDVAAYFNARIKVSQAYNDLVSDIVPKIYNEYIVNELNKVTPIVSKKYFTLEVTDKARLLIIPNLSPINAISWLATYAISASEKNYNYLFYETFDRFCFRTLQDLLKNDTAKQRALEKEYTYYSDNIIPNYNTTIDPNYVISNIQINKRYSTYNKIKKGYVQSSYVELNLFEKAYKISDYDDPSSLNTIHDNSLNTKNFVEKTKFDGNLTEKNRVKYAFNNRTEQDEGYISLDFGDRWTKGSAILGALASIDYTITLQGDTRINLGQFINCKFPEIHGYNNMSSDKFVSGLFFISEIKNIFKPGDYHSTSLRINKDSYGSSIEANSKYGEL